MYVCIHIIKVLVLCRSPHHIIIKDFWALGIFSEYGTYLSRSKFLAQLKYLICVTVTASTIHIHEGHNVIFNNMSMICIITSIVMLVILSLVS
jgi:hypothetical protein